ncbi:MAG: MBL fold metallo-hydrolase [Syntrophomonas sp.]
MTGRFRLIILLLCIFTLLLGGCSSGDNTQRQEASPEKVPALSQQEQSPPAKTILKIHFIDVGQGDSILIQSPQGENLLIDGGETDEGKKVSDYLRAQGIKELAVIVATHPHSDHIGGLIEVINTFPVANVYMPAVTHSSQTFEELLSAIKDQKLKISTARAGVGIPIKGFQAEFLAPQKNQYEDLNNYSAVVRLSYGQNVFLFMGDAEKESEAQIMQSGLNLKADLIKLGHHGSSSSSSPEFLVAAAPRYAVIMCGIGNDYGHPHRETLAVLNKLKVEVSRTDQDGNIVINSDGSHINIKSERGKKLNSEVKSVSDSGESSYYIGNKKTMKFHKPSCQSLPEKQNQVIFGKRDEAISQGYVPCKACKP